MSANPQTSPNPSQAAYEASASASASASSTQAGKISVLGHVPAEDTAILSESALEFLRCLHAEFAPQRAELLKQRRARNQAFVQGSLPDFDPSTAHIRDGAWQVAPLPQELLDRRVEITGPVDRKMIINGLNSGAKVLMADFEDSSAPSWSNMLAGQRHLRDAAMHTIEHHDAARNKTYRLNPNPAVLFVRPRGLHLDEAHMTQDGAPLAAALVDFGLYAFHNTQALLDRGSAPYFYLPKLEHHSEAAFWNSVFVWSQKRLGIQTGTFKATVLIETLPAAFQMDEILHALAQHSAGLNCGRWDYIFSAIKTLQGDPNRVFPDRTSVGMTQPMMRAYARLAVQTCHRRGVHAMGGMAAQIPIKGDPKANDIAMEKVRQDKLREVQDGHDGTWVAHPGLVPVAMEIFDKFMPEKNQISRACDEHRIAAEDLLQAPQGERTEAGLRHNINVGIQYLAAWLDGNGCVPLHHLMEDAATAEISRAQVWQWRRHNAALSDGRIVDTALVQAIIQDEIDTIKVEVGDDAFASGSYMQAKALFCDMVFEDTMTDFLTLAAYPALIQIPSNRRS